MVFRELHRMTAEDADVLRAFVRDTVADAHAKGAVVGISGGIDSAVVTKLCADALGPDKVLAVFLPTDSTPEEDYRQTREMCQQWNVSYEVINIQPSVDAPSEGEHHRPLQDDRTLRQGQTRKPPGIRHI